MEKFKFKKHVNSTLINLKFTAFFNLFADQGQTEVTTSNNGKYINIVNLLTLNSFTNIAARYSMYKITGISLTVTPIHDELSIANHASSVPVYFGIFPTETNIVKTVYEIAEKDDFFMVHPQSPVQHTWTFPDNYMEDTPDGLGIWIPIDSQTQQSGQISFSSYYPGLAFTTNKTLYQVQIDIHISFRDRKV